MTHEAAPGSALTATPGNLRRRPGGWMLVFGIIFPAVVVAMELTTHICAQAFFDPMPTWWHAAIVASVPAGNLLVWTQLREGSLRHARWLNFVNGAVIAIAALYALLFLPLMPMALIGILVGIGLLPLAPLASLTCALMLRRTLASRVNQEDFPPAFNHGLAAGLLLLLALDVPAAATRLGIDWIASGEPSQRERGLALLRSIGDDDLLLRLCYGTTGRPSGPLSPLVLFGDALFVSQPVGITQAEAREIYYRVHGVPFNTKPAPFQNGHWSQFADFQSDNDLGGTRVGGRLKGLNLVSSRLDGSISGNDAVAYLEWTIEFQNSAPLEREVRMQVALPPGGVVSRATLWVNGEEREAAYGGRNEVRAAYERVAVQQRRDPLLVTTKGADRVLAQAFPVPRSGGTIKFKLGITAPLDVTNNSLGRLTLPAIVDRNFSFASDANHNIWIESKQALDTALPGLIATQIEPRLFRIAGAVSDRDLARVRETISVERNGDASRVAARLGENEPVVQQIVRSNVPTTDTVMLVIDGSAPLAGVSERIISALDAIPDNLKVGAIMASGTVQRVAVAPWSGEQRARISALIRSASFLGGQDNTPAIAEALTRLEASPNAMLIWIHGPQPVNFRGGTARLEQATGRLKALPQVILYNVEPGPNELLPDAPWGWGARSLPATDSVDADLAAFFTKLNRTETFVIERAHGQPVGGLDKGSDHIARLWANSRVLELLRTKSLSNRAEAVELAAQYRLVTPVSGAVVLESKQQYDQSRLTPVSPTTVPTVPEPHEWVLILIACALLAWLLYRNRERLVMAP